jgi:shikimate dehydrogenase
MDRSMIVPDAIISTVPGGANDLTFAGPIREGAVLFDVAYDPWPSDLARAWGEVGGTVISGLDLLINQAVGQVRIFVSGDPEIPLTSEPAVIRAMRAAAS